MKIAEELIEYNGEATPFVFTGYYPRPQKVRSEEDREVRLAFIIFNRFLVIDFRPIKPTRIDGMTFP